LKDDDEDDIRELNELGTVYLSLRLTKYQAINLYCEVKVLFHAFLTSA
jgi:hypothetical protein